MGTELAHEENRLASLTAAVAAASSSVSQLLPELQVLREEHETVQHLAGAGCQAEVLAKLAVRTGRVRGGREETHGVIFAAARACAFLPQQTAQQSASQLLNKLPVCLLPLNKLAALLLPLPLPQRLQGRQMELGVLDGDATLWWMLKNRSVRRLDELRGIRARLD